MQLHDFKRCEFKSDVYVYRYTSSPPRQLWWPVPCMMQALLSTYPSSFVADQHHARVRFLYVCGLNDSHLQRSSKLVTCASVSEARIRDRRELFAPPEISLATDGIPSCLCAVGHSTLRERFQWNDLCPDRRMFENIVDHCVRDPTSTRCAPPFESRVSVAKSASPSRYAVSQ